jgi:heme/copper-type cytochrome/quinol oxidase subunit 2
MAIPLPPVDTGHSEKVLRRLAREQREEQETRRTVWAFVWILFTFKICTMILIWYVAAGSGESMAMIISTTWYWLAIPVIALSGRFVYRWRMVKMRRRREELQRAEWRVDPEIVVLRMGESDDRS